MQVLVDTEFSHHGISFDERMAIFLLFHDDDAKGDSDMETIKSISTKQLK